MLAERGIELEVNASDLSRIPKNTPFLIVANRLSDVVDELILIQIFATAYPSFKLLSEKPPGVSSQLDDYFFSSSFHLNLFQNPKYFLETFLKTIDEEKMQQSALAVLVDFSGFRIETITRQHHIRNLFKTLRNARLPILPVRLDSPDRKKLLYKLRQSGDLRDTKITVRIGSLVSVDDQQQFDKRFWKFVRSKIFALGTGLEVKKFFEFTLPTPKNEQEKIIEPVSPELIIREIEQLTFSNLIASQANFDVVVAAAKQIPNTLTEIGRLREITFRSVGEGTGKPLDLDEFDLYYLQLIIWDREEKRIVGGYRLGEGDEIFNKYGIEGFYISSLFKIETGFYPIIQKSVELGRSYIVEDYQKKRLPLFLLWRGILFFLLKNPQYRYLYGPLSISKYYSNVSKSIIVEFIKRYFFDHELSKFLKPRKPFKVRTEKVDIDLLLRNLPAELNALDNFIEDIEPEHFRIPVLLKQYVKQNAKFISFNVDPNFSDVLDGFMILDLNDVPLATIEALKKEVS